MLKSLSEISREQNAPISRVIEAANRLRLGAKTGSHRNATRVLNPAEQVLLVADLRNPERYNQFRANTPQAATTQDSAEFAHLLKTHLEKGDKGQAIAKLAKTQPTAFNVAKAQGLI